jgi:steroid 5-alpha reductase family enzyme
VIAVGPLLLTLLLSTVAVAVLFGATLAVAGAVGKQAVVDVVWGPGFALVALVSAFTAAGSGWRKGLLLALVAGWGLRLGGHIFWRNRGKGEDPRYADIMAQAPGHPVAHAFGKVYLPQALVMWVVSLPVQVGMNTRGGGALVAVGVGIGIAVWLVGFVFETLGDAQLTRFKAQEANRGKVMDSGLWRYTRHPNYFGDVCVWWGIFGVSLGSPWVLLTVVGPLLMTRLLTKTTGKELMEQHLSAREGYADYVERTSGFVPLPPGSRLARSS